MRILLLAGEESGVLYARSIRDAVQRLHPGTEMRGYGDYGFRTEDLAVMGFFAVLKRIFYFLRVKRTMERAIDDWKPDVVCTIDYPGMNLKLAAYAKARGVQAVHVVCPQVWAWKRGRIPKIEAAVDRLCCFFPFEPMLFRPGFAEFVGHPLVDEMAVEKKGRSASCDTGADGKTLAVLPGSRMGEIERHMPILSKVVMTLQQEMPGLQIVIPAANAKALAVISSIIPASAANIHVQLGGARDALRNADAAVVASGTATLEAALAGCPTVLVYRVSWLLAVIARIVIKGVKHIGLANVIAEKTGTECPMPELLQEDFTVDNVLSCLRPWLSDASENAAARKALSDTMRLLRSDGEAIAKIAAMLRPA